MPQAPEVVPVSSGLRRARAARLWFDSLVFLAAGVAGPAWIVSQPWNAGGKAAAWGRLLDGGVLC